MDLRSTAIAKMAIYFVLQSYSLRGRW